MIGNALVNLEEPNFCIDVTVTPATAQAYADDNTQVFAFTCLPPGFLLGAA